MRELTEWLERQAELERRSPCLEDAFLRNRFTPYALYRLRFLLARFALNSALHIAAVLLLAGFFTRREFSAIALAHLLAAFVSSFWWGSLEEMRAHIRRLYRSGRPHIIPKEIGRWLCLSMQLAAVVLSGAMLWLGWHCAIKGPSLSPANAYLLALVLRVALDMPCRCYHSGLYAIRRIYRPLPAMLALDLFGFFSLAALWPLFGRWSFPVASLISTGTVTAVTLHYTRRAYRLAGFQPFRHLGSRRGRRLKADSIRELASAGMASAIMSLDALIALVIFLAEAQREKSSSLFILFFAISPAIRAGYEWAQLFYFDLKRLETAPFGNLSAWLGRRVLGLGWAIGPIFWAAATLAAAAVLHEPIGRLCLPLLPFFHSRALLAAMQVRSFADRAYARLIVNGFLSLAGYLTVGVYLSHTTALVALAAVNYCAVLLLSRQSSGFPFRARWAEPLPPAVWLRQLNSAHRPVQVSAMRYCPNDGEDAWRQNRELSQAKARALARQIARKLGSNGAVTLMHPGRILWFDPAGAEGSALLQWVITRGAGLLERQGQTGLQPSGSAALRHARERGFFGNDVRHSAAPDLKPVRARAAFQQLFPDGVVWSPGEPAEQLASLPPKETRNLLVDASVFVRDLYPNGRRSGLEVTAFCEGSELRAVFVVNRRSDPRARMRWRGLIRNLNLDAATSERSCLVS